MPHPPRRDPPLIASHRTASSFCIALAIATSFAHAEPTLTYPETRQTDQTDDYHGTTIADPYRWLEDDNSDETKAWVKAQNAVTFDYLKGIPGRAAIEKRLTVLWNFERYGLPRRRGERTFYTRNDGLQDQSVLYVDDVLDGEPRVLLDPNKLSKDGTVALASWSVSDDGKLMAYALSAGGSDWHTWHVMDVAERQEPFGYDHLEQVLRRVMAARQQRLLLQRLRPAGGRNRTDGTERIPEAFFSSHWGQAERRQADLPAPRRAAMGLRRRRDGRRPVRCHLGLEGDAAQEPGVLQKDRRPR